LSFLSLLSFSHQKEVIMTIVFINNHGGGFADRIEVAEGTTVKQLFETKLSGCQPQDYLIRVDRLPASADQVLHEGARVSITPTKIAGALLVSRR
jgi:hypothetical protein